MQLSARGIDFASSFFARFDENRRNLDRYWDFV
jgi:hypothetical protein